MNKLLAATVLVMVGCSGTVAPSTQPALLSNAEAQRFGIYSYAVQGDRVLMFDRDGVEAGLLMISVPDTERLVFDFELADGSTDQVELSHPRSDGRYLAP